MLEKRQYPRFRITPDIGLKAELIGKVLQDFELATFGHGGLGFYATRTGTAETQDEIFQLRLKWPQVLSQEIVVSGQFRYAEEAPTKTNPNLLYYGIEFLEAAKERAKPIVTELERRAKTGEVARTSFVVSKKDERR